ncbi:hypothetical protein MMC21_000444 [Puttea exsequens]|nr:hypothetical protein [Puttea exsequens]
MSDTHALIDGKVHSAQDMKPNKYPSLAPVDVIEGARILHEGWDAAKQYDIFLDNGKIKDIQPHESSNFTRTRKHIIDARDSPLAPSLCHAHVHLDKCFLLSEPKYSDLQIEQGTFAEAMALTSAAKARFETDDLVRRGKWLIAESIAAGVTHMRAFVEVDHVVGMKCLEAAAKLKGFFWGACEVQICVFAQEPVFSGKKGEENRRLMEVAVRNECVEVVGTTPYVEEGDAAQKNIEWALKIALEHEKFLDFHLDYNLDPEKRCQAEYLIEEARKQSWTSTTRSGKGQRKTIVASHCTRLTLLNHEQLATLKTSIDSQNLPLHFIGLPTSDTYMQGRPDSPTQPQGQRPRGTLQIPHMIQHHNFRGAIAINNIGNAFTPQGSCDPLSIASMGVGLYHAGRNADVQLLYECVSTRAKEAIGFAGEPFELGADADFVFFSAGGDGEVRASRQRGRGTLREVVYDPPRGRRTIFRGNEIIT